MTTAAERGCTDDAIAIIDAFADLHPAVCLTWHEWRDLQEMIERQLGGNFASDLVEDPLYIKHRRRL